jgi:hypothetical protein
VVEEVSRATGRTIGYEPISLEAYTEGMKAQGLPEAYVWLFGYLFKEVLGNPENQTVSHDVEKVLGRKAIDFSAFAKAEAKKGVWNVPVSQES